MFISKGTFAALAAALLIGTTSLAFAADNTGEGGVKGTGTPPVVNQGAAANSQGVPAQCASISDESKKAACINEYQKNLKDQKSSPSRGTTGSSGSLNR
jgi:hypothetical protein